MPKINESCWRFLFFLHTCMNTIIQHDYRLHNHRKFKKFINYLYFPYFHWSYNIYVIINTSVKGNQNQIFEYQLKKSILLENELGQEKCLKHFNYGDIKQTLVVYIVKQWRKHVTHTYVNILFSKTSWLLNKRVY